MSRPHPARGGACQLIIAITNRRLHVPARNRGVDQYAAPIDLVVPYGSMSKIKSLAIGKGWNKQLRDFNNLMGINVGNKKPAWWLVSNWS